MRKLLLSILFLLCVSNTFAQVKDTLKYRRILLVSYNPDYYLSDAEQDLMQQNKRTPENYRSYLRRSLDNKIAGMLERQLPCFSLLSDTTRKATEATWDFYNYSALQYTKPYGKIPAAEISGKKKDQSKETSLHSAGNYKMPQGDLQVMDNTVKDTEWLNRFAAQYDADLILAINQFEIKTNYNSCMDIANHVYRREVQVHYTLMTTDGKRLTGNVAVAAFASNSNRVEDIAEKVFPEIAATIASRVGANLK